MPVVSCKLYNIPQGRLPYRSGTILYRQSATCISTQCLIGIVPSPMLFLPCFFLAVYTKEKNLTTNAERMQVMHNLTHIQS